MIKRLYSKILNLTIVAIACIASLLPYILILISSFNTSVDIKKGDLFTNASLKTFIANFNVVMSNSDFLVSMGNSILVSVVAVGVGLLFASLAGYAYIIYKSKRTEVLFYISFFCIMIPSTVTIIPLFMMIQKLNMLNSLITISLMSLSLPFLIYLFRQNTKLFPTELIKAARIDGLGEFQIFFKIYVPYMKSIFITSALILFIDSWNSFLIPLVVVLSKNKSTLALYLNNIGSANNSDYGVFMLAIFLSIMPVIILFIVAHKYFRLDTNSSSKL